MDEVLKQKINELEVSALYEIDHIIQNIPKDQVSPNYQPFYKWMQQQQSTVKSSEHHPLQKIIEVNGASPLAKSDALNKNITTLLLGQTDAQESLSIKNGIKKAFLETDSVKSILGKLVEVRKELILNEKLISISLLTFVCST